MSGIATSPPPAQRPGDPVVNIQTAQDGTTRVPVTYGTLKPKRPNYLRSGMCIRSSDRASLVSNDKKFMLFVKPDGEVAVMGPNGNKVWSSSRYHTRIAMITGKAPFRFCLKSNGDLVQYNAKNEIIWTTDTSQKGKGPFSLILNDRSGILVLVDANRVVIWSSVFSMSCDDARSSYLRKYKEVAEAGVDPWLHYKSKVLDKPMDQKEKRIWSGPKCHACDVAKKHYHLHYPETKNNDAAEHYLKKGRMQKRIWTAPLKCLNTIQANRYLEMGKSLYSPDGKHRLVNQVGGNLIVFSTEDKKVLWSLRGNETTHRGNNSATYRLTLREDGNLVYITAKGELIWQSNSGGKANPPFEFRVADKGHLFVFGKTKDGKPMGVWSSQWPKQCEIARKHYLKTYKEVAQANIDPWVHYSQNVLSKPKGEKGSYIWAGPKCVTGCESASAAYHKLYPEVRVRDAARHFAEVGQKQNRVWQGVGNDPYRCVNSVTSPGYIHARITSSNGLYKATLQKRSGDLIVSSQLGVVWQHRNHTSRRPGKGPYSLQLQNDGNLVARNANGSIYWDTNSANMGYPPFKLIVSNTGNLQIMDERRVLVWSTGDGWRRTCAGAQAQYKNENGGTWDDYLKSLLQKPQEKRVWRGPRCNQCSDAYARYLVEYPEVKNTNMNAAEHFVKFGKYQNRLWTGFGDDWKPTQKMILTRPPKRTTTRPPIKPTTTLKPTTRPPTQAPTTTVVDGKVYKLCMNPANATRQDELGRKWGTENGDTCVIYT